MIYFIVNTGKHNQLKDNTCVKIGYSDTMEGITKRRNACQVGNQNKLSILHTEDGDINAEYKLHDMFKDSHIRGEWFKLTEDILDYCRPIKDESMVIDNFMFWKLPSLLYKTI